MTSRPFIAAVLFASDSNPAYQIYGQAYGIEMQVDDEWNTDIILLTSPELLTAVTNETDVTGEDAKIVSAGITNPLKNEDGDASLLSIKHDKNNWLLVGHDRLSQEQGSIGTLVRSASEVGCRVILCVNAADVQSARERIGQCSGVSLKELIVILQAADVRDSDTTMDLIRFAKSQLCGNVASLRFGVECSEANAASWMPSEHLTGVFVVGESQNIFCYVLDIARAVYRNQTHIMTQDAPQLHRYSKVLTISSFFFAVIGVIAGIGILGMLLSNAEGRKDLKSALMSPFLLGAAGYILGMSLAFLFAPASFITSESGRKWMEMVGTKSVGTARAVCATVALLSTAFFGILIWAAATGKF